MKKSYLMFLILFLFILAAAWLKIHRTAPALPYAENISRPTVSADQTEKPQYMAINVLPPEKTPAPAAKQPPAAKQTPAANKPAANKETTKSAGKPDKSGSDGGSNFYAEYDLDMADYLSFMRQRGAKVIIYNLATSAQVCEVSKTGALKTAGNLSGYSSNSRRITDDYPEAETLLSRVEDQYGRSGSYEILLLLPESIVSEVYGEVKRILMSAGLTMSEVSTVFLRYQGTRSNVTVQVERVSGKNGSQFINKSFRL